MWKRYIHVGEELQQEMTSLDNSQSLRHKPSKPTYINNTPQYTELVICYSYFSSYPTALHGNSITLH